ncbi:VWA domain-containing protein [Schlesneria paludicola]|uniref:VWA domain-containing protein n=1 Tax=Schlesneria paludicola TaxID=360056 RepID=UPI0004928FD5|nr:VWA domain-containing protein [Schlesneria paludicola]
MSSQHLGGVIHTYQRYDPSRIPGPTVPPPDLTSAAFEHMLEYGSLRELTDEELARAVKLDIRQIAGLGPSLESLQKMLQERKRKILETWETKKVVEEVKRQYLKQAGKTTPPDELKSAFQNAVDEEQIRDLERLWYRAGDDRSRFARQLVQLVDRLGDKYQIDELASKYEFTGRKPLDVDQALAVKEELETIDRLLRQLEEAKKSAQIALIDLSELSQFADSEQMDELSQLQQQVSELVRQMAEQQGLEKTSKGYQLTPQAYRIFQGKLLEQIFSQLQESRTGRHLGPIQGEGAVELPVTKQYEFGDSVSQMDIPQSLINAMIRDPARPLRLRSDDIVIHKTRNNPKCATAVLMDMSGSMRHGGQYINVKRMALALDGLIRREFPGDFLQFIEMASFAKPRHFSEVASLLPKVVTIFDPVVRLRADMSREDITESDIPPHFTNIQHALQLGRQYLSTRDTPNRQIVLITDGLPTAHFEGPFLYLLYPSDPKTEAATMREAMLCHREGIVINIFLLQSWSQSHEDIRFAHRLAETTNGRVFFTAGRDLDRFVVWDYVNRRKSIIG